MSYRLKQGRKGLELHGRNMVVEEGSPKFNQLLDQLGDAIEIDEPPQRMAGEDKLVQEALAYLEKQEAGEIAIDSAMNDAMEVVRISNYNRHMAKQAGIPKSMQDLEKGLLVDNMANGVPMPIVRPDRARNIERRIHTEEVKNPVTGVLQVVPFEDVSTGKALVTELGRNVNMEGEKKASEYIQNHILKLMGLNPRRGPKYGVDFKADMGNGEIGIDGQTEATGYQPLVEILTKAIPTDRRPGGYGYGYGNDYRNKRAIKDNTRNMIKREMARGETVGSAIDNLVGNGLRDDPNIDGKLLKKGYDKILMPMQNEEMHELNRKVKDKIAIAPDSVVMYDLNKIRPSIMESTNPDILRVAYNAGDADSRDKQARAKVRGVVPAHQVKDVVGMNPYVAQILSTLQ